MADFGRPSFGNAGFEPGGRGFESLRARQALKRVDEPGVTAALVREEPGISRIGSEIHGSPIDYEEANFRHWSRYGVASRAGTSSAQHRKEAEHDECRDKSAFQ